MKAYLVGGYVRDQQMNKLLNKNIQPKDRDWVVVGATEEEMLAKGFNKVGAFPVFLHPKTKEEWALARTEKKAGYGYTGFVVDFTPSVTLEEDLTRRDLTINAMAKEPDSDHLIDPFNGSDDIKNKILRHVSNAFVEDPLRVLRVARFATRFNDFSIAPKTLGAMRKIADSGELAHLTPERIWQETHRALQEDHPIIFFNVLTQCNGLYALWPYIADYNKQINTQVPDNGDWLAPLHCASQITNKTTIRFAALSFGIASLYVEKQSAIVVARNFCQHLKVPNSLQQIAVKLCQYHHAIQQCLTAKPDEVLSTLNKLDVWRKYEEFQEVLMASKAVYLACNKPENGAYPQVEFLTSTVDACLLVTAAPFIAKGAKGKAIKDAIDNSRVRVINEIQQAFRKQHAN